MAEPKFAFTRHCVVVGVECGPQRKTWAIMTTHSLGRTVVGRVLNVVNY